METFLEEEPTKPEITEPLVETLERLRTEPNTRRPSVRMKAITNAPASEQV